MNYLALVNALRAECGVSGSTLTTLQTPTSLEAVRMNNWIATAWETIQTLREDWQFMRQPFSFTGIASQQSYAPGAYPVSLTSFGNWKRDSFRCSTVGLNNGDEQLLNFLPYDRFRNLYQYGQMRSVTQRPVVVSVDPQKNLLLGPKPDVAYVINGEYYTAPVTLSADADTPTMPARYHRMIVYLAMMYYGGFEAATEVYQRGENEYKRTLAQLQIDQLPTMMSGAPLA